MTYHREPWEPRCHGHNFTETEIEVFVFDVEAQKTFYYNQSFIYLTFNQPKVDQGASQ